MEALPKLPMLSFELKHCPEYIDFAPTLKQYIKDHYGEDAALYNKACSDLEQLRQSAIQVSRDFMGCTTLKKYYAQLQYLQGRFPMGEGEECSIYFTWEDVQTGRDHRMSDIKFEQACVLYNIGSLHSLLGALDSRHNAEGMKVSCTHFQCAAWAFEHLRDNFGSSSMSTDMSYELLSFHIILMLAQAQECILEKSMIDNRKNNITAKVAAQVVDFYKDASRLIDLADQKQQINSRMHKEWGRRLTMKAAFYQCITYYFLGRQSEEAEKHGECLAYYTAARDELNRATQLAKNEVSEVSDCLHFAKDVVMGKYESAKKDNDFVYHDKVPPLDSLPEVKGASLVKGIPFNPSDKEISGPDIFLKLVPMEAHEASSVYSEEKAKLSRTVVGDIEQKNMELEQFLSSLQLDLEQLMPKPDLIPENLMEKCAAMSVRTNAIKELTDSMASVSGLSTEVEMSIGEIQQMIEEDQEKTDQFEKQFGKKNPSSVLPRLLDDLKEFRKRHEEGSQLNTTLHKAMNTHTSNLKTLVLPPSEIQGLLPPSQPTLSPEDEAIVTEIRRLMQKVTEMKEQRKALLDQFRDQIQKDDITNVLVTQEKSDKESVFQEQLQKHSQIVNYIKQNLSAQDNILRHLTDTNAKYAMIRQAYQDASTRREKVVQDLILSYEKYEELLAKSQKGGEYYKKLLENVNKTLERCASECKVRQEERDMLIAKFAPKAPAPSRPLAPKPGSSNAGTPASTPMTPDLGAGTNLPSLPPGQDFGALPPSAQPSTQFQSMPPSFEGPKLKDYLPFMKPRSFGPKAPAMASQDSVPLSPSVPSEMPQYDSGDYNSAMKYPGLDPNLASVLPATIAQYLASVSAAGTSMAGGSRHSPSSSPSPQHNRTATPPRHSPSPLAHATPPASPAMFQGPHSMGGSPQPLGQVIPARYSSPVPQESFRPPAPASQGYPASTGHQNIPSTYLPQQNPAVPEAGRYPSHQAPGGQPQQFASGPASGLSGANNVSQHQQPQPANLLPPQQQPHPPQAPQAYQQYGYLSGVGHPQQHPGMSRHDNTSIVSAVSRPIFSPGQETMNHAPLTHHHQHPQYMPQAQAQPQPQHSQAMPSQQHPQQMSSIPQQQQPQAGPMSFQPGQQYGPASNTYQPQQQFGPTQAQPANSQQVPPQNIQQQNQIASYGQQPLPGQGQIPPGQGQPAPSQSQVPTNKGQGQGQFSAAAQGQTPFSQPGMAKGVPYGAPGYGVQSQGQQQPSGQTMPGQQYQPTPFGGARVPVTSVGYGYGKEQGAYSSDFAYPSQQWYYPSGTTTAYQPSQQYQGGYQHSVNLSYQHAQKFGTFTSKALMYGDSGQAISTQSQTANTQTTFSQNSGQISQGQISQGQAQANQQQMQGGQVAGQGQGLQMRSQVQGPLVQSQVQGQQQIPGQQMQGQGPQPQGQFQAPQNPAQIQRPPLPGQAQGLPMQGQNQIQGPQFQGQVQGSQLQGQVAGNQLQPMVPQGQYPQQANMPQTQQQLQQRLPGPVMSSQPQMSNQATPQPLQQQQNPQQIPNQQQQQLRFQQPQTGFQPIPSSQQPAGMQPYQHQQLQQQLHQHQQLQQQQQAMGPFGPQPHLQQQGPSQQIANSAQPGMPGNMASLQTPLQPTVTGTVRPGTPNQVLSRPSTPGSQVSNNAPPTPTSPIGSKRSVSRQSSSLDDILSSSPNGVKDTIITPQVLTDQERQLQKEEAMKNQVIAPTSEPYTSQGALNKLLGDVESFGKFVDELSVTILGVSRLDTVWKSLLDSQDTATKKMSIAIARCYPMKNRDPDIMPYDETRVVMTTTKDDYINASWLNDLAPSCPKFITTQAPMPLTMGEFWAMVYEQGSEVLVQITSEYETGKKFPVYFPTEKDKTMEHGVMLLSLQSVKFRQHWVERIVYLKNTQTKQGRTIVHLQFKNWPVSGFPDDVSSIVHFISEVHSFYMQQRSLTKPIIVHCGSGIGRTGVFILVYTAMQEILHGNGLVDLPGLARRMLQKRRGILHKKEQLKCCYDAVLCFAEEYLQKRGVLVKNPHFSTDKRQPVKGSPKHHSSIPAPDDIVLGTVDLQTIRENVGRLHVHSHTNNLELEKKDDMSISSDNSLRQKSESLSSISNSSLPDVVQQYSDTQSFGELGDKAGSVESRSGSDPSVVGSLNLQMGSGPPSLTSGPQSLTPIVDMNPGQTMLPGGPATPMDHSIAPQGVLQPDGKDVPASLAQLQDPATFTMGSPDAKKKNKVTKGNFGQLQGTLQSSTADPDDPLGSLDPMWSLAKNKK